QKFDGPIPLVGPLAILNPCVPVEKRLSGDPFVKLKHLRKSFDGANIAKLFHSISEIMDSSWIDYDQFDHSSSPVSCLLCETPISSASSLIKHIVSKPHMTKIQESAAPIDSDSFYFWKNAVDESFYKKKIGLPPPIDHEFRTFQLENGQILPITGINPFSILDPIVARSMSEDASILAGQMYNLFLERGESKFLSSTRSLITAEESVFCKLCNSEIAT
ncbi:hypothetical protein PFISCL1PPCAC_6752, partial [Pristionchus fissidentatus]